MLNVIIMMSIVMLSVCVTLDLDRNAHGELYMGPRHSANMTLSIMAPSIKALCIECHMLSRYAEHLISFIFMRNVVMLSVIMLNVVAHFILVNNFHSTKKFY
jgi:hypothetical protein